MQDLPPPKGFAPITYKRNVPNKGPPGIVLFAGIGMLMMYGFVKVAQGKREM